VATWNLVIGRDSNGKLKYASLGKIIVNDILDDEQFWNISHYDQWVVFNH
jgi:hypothetical protein